MTFISHLDLSNTPPHSQFLLHRRMAICLARAESITLENSNPTLNEFFWVAEFSDPDARANMPADLLSVHEDDRHYFQVGQPIRFRIEEEHFYDVGPKEAPKAPDAVPEGTELSALEQQLRQERQEGIPPYSLVVSLSSNFIFFVSHVYAHHKEQTHLE